MKNRIVVVFSGGQDSTTCLASAVNTIGAKNVYAIAFNYGQKHLVEIKCARRICKVLKVKLKVVDLSFFGDLVTSALTRNGDVNKAHAYKTELPASFVPNRNALFLTIAHAYAQEVGAGTIATGVCQTDYSGYPDCRRNFINELQGALNTGYQTDIAIWTPLMHMTKAEIFQLADQCNVLDLVIDESHTCYNGDRTAKHDWGFGCGTCPACELRKKGYEEFIAKKGLK